MDNVQKKSLILALLFAIFSTLLIIYYVNQNTTPVTEQKMVEVWVATIDLMKDHKITSRDIKKVRVTHDALLSSRLEKPEQIVGKFVKETIYQGEQISKSRLFLDDDNRFSIGIDKNMRAISVYVNEETMVSNLLHIGDTVDVIANIDKDEAEQALRQSKTIVQNAKVLHIGVGNKKDDKLKELPKTVTLLVNAYDAEKLSFASKFGTIHLSVKNISDKEWIGLPGVMRNQLMSNGG